MGSKTHVADFNVNQNGNILQVSVKVPDNRYLDKFIGHWNCAADILLLGIFPNAKEITESFAATHHAIRGLRHFYNGQKFTDRADFWAYTLGDGAYPRTSVSAAFTTKWQCVSVDPALNTSKDYSQIKNVRLAKVGCEDYNFSDEEKGECAVVMSVHNHASCEQINLFLENAARRFNRIVFVDMPCCVKHPEDKFKIPTWRTNDFGQVKMTANNLKHINTEYDWGIHSPEREVSLFTWENKIND